MHLIDIFLLHKHKNPFLSKDFKDIRPLMSRTNGKIINNVIKSERFGKLLHITLVMINI